mgnify:CR=1 FL=1
MKKMGTVSFALGLIYYGVWLAMKNTSTTIANELFKLWPVIFIILGIEILISSRKSMEGTPHHFNGGVIFIILLFFFTNVYNDTYGFINKGFSGLSNNFWNISFDSNTKDIEASKVITTKDKKFRFETKNGSVNIKKSNDGNVRLQLTIKVNNDNQGKKYEINDKNQDGFDSVDIDENYVKGVEGTIYIPDGFDLSLMINNSKISTYDNLSNSTMDIQSQNGKFDVQSLANLNIDTNNADLDIKDVNNIKVKGNNIKNNIDGNVENADIDMENGTVDINNYNFTRIKINANNAVVKLNTKEKNIKASLSCKMGSIKFNDEHLNNGELKRNTGDGSNSADITLKLGSIKISSQE